MERTVKGAASRRAMMGVIVPVRVDQDVADHRHMGRKVVMCFFDLEKALDTVRHRALLARPSKVFGVRGAALEWLEFIRLFLIMAVFSPFFSIAQPPGHPYQVNR